MSGVASCGMSGVGLIPIALQRGYPGANVVILTCTTVGAATLTFQRLGAVAGQYFEIMMWGTSVNVGLLATAAGAGPARPASPSMILTCNRIK